MHSKDGDWPWHAIVFHKTEKYKLEYKCGGTILDQSTVLTAAHCLVTSAGVLALESVLVQVGRTRLLVANNRAQEFDVLRIILHAKYTMHSQRHDIALVKLVNQITYTNYIQPICLWNQGEDFVNRTGSVIGFGNSGGHTNMLQEARMRIVNTLECIDDNPAYRFQIAPGMFCAGNRDGVGPSNGDSGGGMFFKYNDVWYIRGVVSFTKTDSSNIGDAKEYIVFTDVAVYKDWIEQNLSRNSEPPLDLGPNLPQTCGKRKAVSFLITHGYDAKEGFWPWHAALFHASGRQLNYLCGGTIIDQNMILTTATCMNLFKGKRALVHVGLTRIGQANNRAQQHEALDLIVHPRYSTNSVDYDIALIRLATDITYTDYIQPVCLWKEDDDQQTIVNKLGTVIGFGFDETDQISETLREARIPVVSALECLEKNQGDFASRLTTRMFCAGYRNGTGACNGDNGGGLFFNEGDTWYIRGIASFTKPRDDSNVCDSNDYTVYVDVAKYLKWIKQYLRDTDGQPRKSLF
uniref:Peptidase S1 domain-containing protein n=1 Tax=Anopheles farauti TaxID=69004 RepID=A0A182Q8F5_9DIPT